MGASYTYTDVDALVELLRRLPEEYHLELVEDDTEMMISWMSTAQEHNWLSITHYGEWLAWFKDHAAWLRNEENAVRLDKIHRTHFVIMVVAIWTASFTSITAAFPFSPDQMNWLREFYGTLCETLDIELV